MSQISRQTVLSLIVILPILMECEEHVLSLEEPEQLHGLSEPTNLSQDLQQELTIPSLL